MFKERYLVSACHHVGKFDIGNRLKNAVMVMGTRWGRERMEDGIWKTSLLGQTDFDVRGVPSPPYLVDESKGITCNYKSEIKGLRLLCRDLNLIVRLLIQLCTASATGTYECLYMTLIGLGQQFTLVS
jgi:hypothetical protein